MESGQAPLQAGVIGTREIFFAVIATTLSLVAVLLPVMFLSGLTGRLFREFGATGERYDFADVIRLAGEVSGSSQKEFFDRYVEGAEYLDIRPSFDAIGLRLTTMMDEFYLSDRAGATPAQRAMAASIFGHRQ